MSLLLKIAYAVDVRDFKMNMKNVLYHVSSVNSYMQKFNLNIHLLTLLMPADIIKIFLFLFICDRDTIIHISAWFRCHLSTSIVFKPLMIQNVITILQTWSQIGHMCPIYQLTLWIFIYIWCIFSNIESVFRVASSCLLSFPASRMFYDSMCNCHPPFYPSATGVVMGRADWAYMPWINRTTESIDACMLYCLFRYSIKTCKL